MKNGGRIINGWGGGGGGGIIRPKKWAFSYFMANIEIAE
jgi:hypothetical protein